MKLEQIVFRVSIVCAVACSIMACDLVRDSDHKGAVPEGLETHGITGETENIEDLGSAGERALGLAVDESKLHRFLRSSVDNGFSGVVLLKVGGQLIDFNAYSEDSAEMERAACFWIGSVSKSVTAATIVRLSTLGLIDLHSPISDYLTDTPADKAEVTVHHLMTHTSGFGNSYVADGIISQESTIQTILSQPLQSAPGSAYSYSAEGYNLLAILIELVTGDSFESVVQELILNPAGMSEAGFWGEAMREGGCQLAPAKDNLPEGSKRANYGFRGSTGLRASALDLESWHDALLSDSVLSTVEKASIFGRHALISKDIFYGYGWNVMSTKRGTTLYVHLGAEDALDHYAAIYRFVDEDVLLIVLANSSEQSFKDVLRGLQSLVFN